MLWSTWRLHTEIQEEDGVYDHLSKDSRAKWFHPNGENKENYKCYVELGTTFAKFVQHPPKLDAHPGFKEEICKVLKKHKVESKTTLFVVCIQHLIKAIILKQAPHLLEKTHMTKFHVSYSWTKKFIKSQFN
jgi:hypothetical protein